VSSSHDLLDDTGDRFDGGLVELAKIGFVEVEKGDDPVGDWSSPPCSGMT
jgi:hypothetical protein